MAVHGVMTAHQPVEIAPVTQPPRRGVSPTLFVVVGYVLIGLLAYRPALHQLSQNLFSLYGDFTLTIWFLGWVPHALAHGLNPFYSHYLFVPTGVNLAQNTEGPLLGLVAAPITLAFGPLVTANLLLVTAMPLSATAAFVVLRKWQLWWPAAAVGGLIYGFSPYMVGQAVDHPVLLFLPLPPFIAFTIASILQRRGSPLRLGIQLGLLVAAQYLISQEVLATVAIFAMIAIVCIAACHPLNIPEMVRAGLAPAGIALGVAVALLAYPVWMLTAGPQHVNGSTFPIANPYHNDLLSFVVPGPLQKVSLGMGSLGTHLVGQSNPTETGGYIGIPLFVIIGIFAWRSRRSPRMQLATVLLIVAALLSLGPYLTVNGHLTHVPLPFWLLVHLPLLNNVLPNRISFEMDACIAAIVGFGLDDFRRIPRARKHSPSRRARRAWGGAVAAGVTLAVVVVFQLPQWPNASGPAVVLPPEVLRAIPAGDPVAITYPYDAGLITEPMLWQAEGGFPFRLVGGYAYHPDASGRGTLVPTLLNPPDMEVFLWNREQQSLSDPSLPITPALAASTRETLSKYGVRVAIVDRSSGGSAQAMDLFREVLGPPKLSSGQFTLWADWPGASAT